MRAYRIARTITNRLSLSRQIGNSKPTSASALILVVAFDGAAIYVINAHRVYFLRFSSPFPAMHAAFRIRPMNNSNTALLHERPASVAWLLFSKLQLVLLHHINISSSSSNSSNNTHTHTFSDIQCWPIRHNITIYTYYNIHTYNTSNTTCNTQTVCTLFPWTREGNSSISFFHPSTPHSNAHHGRNSRTMPTSVRLKYIMAHQRKQWM